MRSWTDSVTTIKEDGKEVEDKEGGPGRALELSLRRNELLEA
jgi:hypothetical protein